VPFSHRIDRPSRTARGLGPGLFVVPESDVPIGAARIALPSLAGAVAVAAGTLGADLGVFATGEIAPTFVPIAVARRFMALAPPSNANAADTIRFPSPGLRIVALGSASSSIPTAIAALPIRASPHAESLPTFEIAHPALDEAIASLTVAFSLPAKPLVALGLARSPREDTGPNLAIASRPAVIPIAAPTIASSRAATPLRSADVASKLTTVARSFAPQASAAEAMAVVSFAKAFRTTRIALSHDEKPLRNAASPSSSPADSPTSIAARLPTPAIAFAIFEVSSLEPLSAIRRAGIPPLRGEADFASPSGPSARQRGRWLPCEAPSSRCDLLSARCGAPSWRPQEAFACIQRPLSAVQAPWRASRGPVPHTTPVPSTLRDVFVQSALRTRRCKARLTDTAHHAHQHMHAACQLF
jgi:hypothetical protein